MGKKGKIDTSATAGEDQETVYYDYCIFNVGNEFFAITLDEITEVLHDVEIEKIAHLSDYYCGTIRNRGVTLPVIDMDKILKQDRPDGSINTCILLKGTDGIYSMLIDSDVDIVQVTQEQVHPLPDCFSAEEAIIFNGILVYKDNIYGILNPSEIYKISQKKEV